MLVAEAPPLIWRAVATANVVNGFRFAIARLRGSVPALRKVKSGVRLVTRSVPPVPSMNKG